MGLPYNLATLSMVSFLMLALLCNVRKSVCQDEKPQGPRIVIKDAGLCEGSNYARLPVAFDRPVFTKLEETGGFFMSTTIVARKDIRELIVEMEVSQCTTEEEHTCGKTESINCTNACEIMHQKNKIWSTVVSNIKNMPQKCPIPKGRYVMRNGYIDFEKGFTDITATTAGFWTGRLTFYDKKGILQCLWGSGIIKRS